MPALADREQEVLLWIIQQHGRTALLADSTFGRGCTSDAHPSCGNPGVAQAVWTSYLNTSRNRVPLRDLLPAGAGTFASEVDQSRIPCERHRRRLQLSRVGLSPDGSEAVVSYSTWIPMRNHFGCGAVSGATVLLRRQQDGTWEEARILSTVIS